MKPGEVAGGEHHIYSTEPDWVYVVAVMHLKRKPGYWVKRTRN